MESSATPLAPAAFYILFALAGGAKHGYAIMQEARTLSDSAFDLGPATLYTTIQRLLDSGWIEEVEGPAGSDSRRRYYSLTREGNSTFQAEVQRMEAIVKKSKALRLRPARSSS
ncbi:MAG TPA: helix-turn-helix transcriptional regulator [Bryobacteraceae bacterium]|nr:helix-turn-helix transcriptional regulator [Bryobacteraceae bacterium]